MSYALALIFPFTGTKRPSLKHEKQPQIIIPLPATFTVVSMRGGRQRSSGIRQTQIGPADCQMVKRDSLLQRTCSTAPESNDSKLYTTQADAWHCTWFSKACVRLLGHGNPFMKLLTKCSCADADSRVRLEVCSERCNRGQTIFTRFAHQHLVVQFCELVCPTTSRL